MQEKKFYIGLMSGTSLDGIDVVLTDFNQAQPKLIASYEHPIPKEIKKTIVDTIQPNWLGSLEDIGILNHQLGQLFADATLSFIQKESIEKHLISAIASHGQTLWHQPFGKHPFSMQLGDASIIAEQTSITTVSDFRSRDVSAGGQGAPLVPAFHLETLSHLSRNRVILNIGGIANISTLPSIQSQKLSSGYDTGPGNGLIDAWIHLHQNKSYDKNGDWGRSGEILPDVLAILLDDSYFSKKPPKSTGKEAFNIDWLKQLLGESLHSHKAEDIQATLTELTAISIANNIPSNFKELFVCGGGVHNTFLLERLKHHLPHTIINSTKALGIDPNWMEAMAFAWLAKQTIEGKTSNLPEVTGASGKRILGAIHRSS